MESDFASDVWINLDEELLFCLDNGVPEGLQHFTLPSCQIAVQEEVRDVRMGEMDCLYSIMAIEDHVDLYGIFIYTGIVPTYNNI